MAVCMDLGDQSHFHALVINYEASRAILNDCRDSPVILSKRLAFYLLKISPNRRHCLIFYCFARCYSLVKNNRTMPIGAVYLENGVYHEV